jgi:hypothetical protein
MVDDFERYRAEATFTAHSEAPIYLMGERGGGGGGGTMRKEKRGETQEWEECETGE